MIYNSTNTILMIRPSIFRFNKETAVNNVYQHSDDFTSELEVSNKAIQEFDDFVYELKLNNINVIIFQDHGEGSTPDSLFPNNWISTHQNGSICIYPMFAQNRRLERRKDIVNFFDNNFNVNFIVNEFISYENENKFLEGTGSMVLDRLNKVAYAALSDRTNNHIFKLWCNKFGYEAVSFCSKKTKDGFSVYHTNVLMSICTKIAICCFDALSCKDDRLLLMDYFRKTKKEIIDISVDQKNKFLGNVLELRSNANTLLLIMSSSAFSSLRKQQKKIINQHYTIVHSSLKTIEYFGGGSARCMIAEVYLKNKKYDFLP